MAEARMELADRGWALGREVGEDVDLSLRERQVSKRLLEIQADLVAGSLKAASTKYQALTPRRSLPQTIPISYQLTTSAAT